MDARISTKQAVVLGRVTQSFMNEVNPKVNSIAERSIVFVLTIPIQISLIWRVL